MWRRRAEIALVLVSVSSAFAPIACPNPLVTLLTDGHGPLCLADSAVRPNLPCRVATNDTLMTYQRCATLCAQNGSYGTAGVENGGDCYCSPAAEVGPRGNVTASTRCDVPCPGTAASKQPKMCGGTCTQIQFMFTCPFACVNATCVQVAHGAYRSCAHACGGSEAAAVRHDIGALVLAVFFGGLVVYGLGGAAFLYGRGRRGANAIPHLNAIKNLASLVRDGAQFTTKKLTESLGFGDRVGYAGLATEPTAPVSANS